MQVGNLLIDPSANSFISLSDAVAFLEAEFYEDTSTPSGVWLEMDEELQDGTLIRASRWMRDALPWIRRNLTPAELAIVGQAAVRLAVASPSLDLYRADNPSKQIKSTKAGSVSVEFADGSLTAHAAGLRWPWLPTMLFGLIAEAHRPRLGIGAFVV